jgi:translation initiation factor IF-3
MRGIRFAVLLVLLSFLQFSTKAFRFPPVVSSNQIFRLNTFNRKWNIVHKPKEVVPHLPINEQITAPEVRVVVDGKDGEKDAMIGIIPLQQALELAQKVNLDLVLMNENMQPPLCRVTDYSKYRYEQEKKLKEKTHKQRTLNELKTIKLGMTIQKHDMEVWLKKALEWLTAGHRVHITLVIEGRQTEGTAEMAQGVLNQFSSTLATISTTEQVPRSGRNMEMILTPKKK